MWETRRRHRPLIAPLLQKVSDLSLAFQTFDILYARRSSNYFTQTCASHACVNNVSEEWMDATLVFLQNNLRADCNGCLMS